MSTINRGIRNAFRNIVRTFSIIVILGISISLTLVMFLALKTVQAKIDSVKAAIGNTITVTPAGIRGFEGGGELLTSADADSIASISHVTKVIKTTSDQLHQPGTSLPSFRGPESNEVENNSTTTLVSPIEPGNFGNRTGKARGLVVSGNAPDMSKFKLPVAVTGTNDISAASLNASTLDITNGEKIDPNSNDNVAMLGKDLASKNNLTVGSTFQAYGNEIRVVGIYDAGNTFNNAGLVMPIATIQKLSGQTDQINILTVQADSIDSLAGVQSAIKDKLGSKVDLVSSQDSEKVAIAPLENIKTIALYSLIGAVIAGSIIIFLTMIMIVRERRREIGVLKAIGASNIKIVSQFITESLSLTLISSVIGAALGAALSNPILKVLVENSSNQPTIPDKVQTFSSGGGGGAVLRGSGGTFMKVVGGGAAKIGDTLKDIHALVGWEIILYGLAAAIIIAIIGSAIPAFLIAKVRPAEVMRAE